MKLIKTVFLDLVTCGSHKAPTCTDCPIRKDGTWAGESWCHGECNWVYGLQNDRGTCVPKESEAKSL